MVVVIDKITDLEALKTLAKGMQTYQARLERRNKELSEELARLRGEVTPEQLALLAIKQEEELARLRQRVFGASSERRTPPPAEAPKPKERQRGHGPTPQPRLPLSEVRHELAPESRQCPACHGEVGELEDMGLTEDSELITIEARRIVRELHRRRKYRCRCNAAVVTAPGPLRLIPGGRYSIDFGIAVVLDKRENHLPLERQRRRMAREGLDITTQTLCDVEGAVAELLRPSYEKVLAYIQGSDEVGADETRWRMMGSAGSKTWWVWCLTTDDAAFYAIDPSRSGEPARRLLGGFEGTVVCDGYSVYGSLAKSVPGLRLQHCWSHVRRKFFEVQTKYPVECEEALRQIDALFVVERGLPPLRDLEGDAKSAAHEERARVRHEVSRPRVDALFGWARKQRALPSSGLAGALRYLVDHERGLRAFLDDPTIPIDNNRAERALRRVVVGRKNHYGSRSVRGTEVAAILYTMIETCRLCGVDPEYYLREALMRAVTCRGAALLPQALPRGPSG